jgi:hypothetical protein
MRLLNASTKQLEEFYDDAIPPYAILSHTWEKDEVTFKDLRDPNHTSKDGYGKILGSCSVALSQDLGYIWLDTCCIDKSSSAELSEAINSMFEWYQNSAVCYVYLEDVPDNDDIRTSSFRKSKWLTRGWTLQEFLAPSKLEFYTSSWHWLCDYHQDNRSLQLFLKCVTGIDKENWEKAGTAEKLSWAAERTTTRKEDAAYCLMGLLGINMPLLYGEGERAFTRLLSEVMRVSNRHDVLAAGFGLPYYPTRLVCATARSPREFRGCRGGFVVHRVLASSKAASSHFSMTNAGLQIELPLVEIDPGARTALGLLDCARLRSRADPQTRYDKNPRASYLPVYSRLAIPLVRVSPDDDSTYARACGSQPLLVPTREHEDLKRTTIYITNVDPPPASEVFYLYTKDLDNLGYALYSFYPSCSVTEQRATGELMIGIEPKMHRLLLVFSKFPRKESVLVYIQFAWSDSGFCSISSYLSPSSSSSALEILLGIDQDGADLENPVQRSSWSRLRARFRTRAQTSPAIAVGFDRLERLYNWETGIELGVGQKITTHSATSGIEAMVSEYGTPMREHISVYTDYDESVQACCVRIFSDSC